MLSTKIHSEATPRQVKRSTLTDGSASAIYNQSPAIFDLELLQELHKSKILDRLKDMFQLAQADNRSSDRAIRLPEVLHILGIGKSSWYQRLSARSSSYDPLAPQPFKLGTSERSPSVWWHSEIIAYLQAHAAASRNR
ncbi:MULTISPECIES: AlpA family phage regulatory protein [Xanthomonas]|uniref:helix-turn-helix transcriptional regulator n=1 Tax=Xanthomonas TaxID=338 RepID=UPI001431A486|nr:MULTISPECIES: AlpA family phage regulatory protein [Xanthomonas]MBB5866607.1 putative DNA-binding transcriptional regulator AlpA [Xanthomonas sp. 3058]NJC00228.1 putative DNA-binding transcriptional regulator AlpA [Xanthomonas arboricola]